MAKKGTPELYEEACDSYADGRYQESYLALLELSLLIDQTLDAGYYGEMAAMCLQKLGRNDEAIIWLERAVMERPNFPPYEEALEKAKRGEMISKD